VRQSVTPVALVAAPSVVQPVPGHPARATVESASVAVTQPLIVVPVVVVPVGTLIKTVEMVHPV